MTALLPRAFVWHFIGPALAIVFGVFLLAFGHFWLKPMHKQLRKTDSLKAVISKIENMDYSGRKRPTGLIDLLKADEEGLRISYQWSDLLIRFIRFNGVLFVLLGVCWWVGLRDVIKRVALEKSSNAL